MVETSNDGQTTRLRYPIADQEGSLADDQKRRHILTGFPDAAIHFQRALEDNRLRIALDHGLSAIELRSLFRIALIGSMTPKQLAEDLSLSSAAITGLSTRLVSSGMLRRVEHPRDRRSLWLELTEAGHTTMAEIHTDFNSMVTDATGELGEQDLEIATASLREVTRAIRVRLAAPEEPDGVRSEQATDRR